MQASQDHLFSLAIPPHRSPGVPSPGGKITVTRLVTTSTTLNTISSHPSQGKPRPQQSDTPLPPIYVLTFYSPPDNRLTPAFLRTFLIALTRLQCSQPPGLLLTTSSIPKFYSNGLDLATFTPETKARFLFPLWRKLLTYPMVTCAVVNGHAFAGGFMTAMAHDYRIMNAHRGWLCLNELEFDAELAPGMAALVKAKVSNTAYRSLVLEARRVTSLQALEMGLVDGLGGLEEAAKIMTDVEGGHGRGSVVVGVRGKPGVYGKLKEEMYKDLLRELNVSTEEEAKMWEDREADRARQDEEDRKIAGEVRAKL